MFMKVLKIILKLIVYGFAVIGLILTAGWFAVKYNLTMTVAMVDKNNDKYQAASLKYAAADKYDQLATSTSGSTSTLAIDDLERQITELNNTSQQLSELKLRKLRDLCKISVIGEAAPVNAKNILDVYKQNASEWLFNQMVLAVSLRLENNADWQSRLDDCDTVSIISLSEAEIIKAYAAAQGQNIFPWSNTESWSVVERAVLKDEAVIRKAAKEAGVDPRTIVSILIVEQLRLYNTQREYFEKFFKPLSILASANKMAWGVMAIKEITAIDVEKNLTSPNSAFYIGESYTHLLDFTSADIPKERYDRLTNNKDHYYSYLYGGLLIKQLIAQWDKSGYNIARRPELISTLFNIGFTRSKPKADPQVGGSIITISGVDYTFGSLSHEFYYSGLLSQFGY
ncbi:hypothetical protein COX68_00080 [Candidatus Falkowbacteria bacterium CG_4_10_14_0_2_um_filter_41_15]|uniref:Uncharacterized protein n=2 Tax=Candidatus Falkowiibacteriota TaxID=1752728 RepID=A0A2M7RX78_9BACT|nr:MAG: hypothetical protein COY54_02445 [Candidatus Falkowbacteria bacterium CG_4_10_14_0_8_um_filter_41_36]PJA10583.1 MAG: hypothetical protein COX68_00080 [Candidatus Falkowbacteria bacterium CG_4_10_14_0_2_um_filter_41_15]